MLEPDFPLRKLVVNPANEQLVHSGYLAALIREGAGGAPFQLASKKSMNDGNGMADGNPADKVETG